MLTNFRVRNFKAFEDTETINLKPLVLLSGVNSAGKSSILQALLLLKQTLESRSDQVLNPVEPLFLGTSDEFLFGGDQGKDEDPRLLYDLTFVYVGQRAAAGLESTAQSKSIIEYEVNKQLTAIYNQNETFGNIMFLNKRHVDLLNKLAAAFPDISIVSNNGKLTCHLRIAFAWGTLGLQKQRTVQVSDLQILLKIDDKLLLGLTVNRGQSAGIYRLTLRKDKTCSKLQDLAIEQLEIDSFDHFLPESVILSQQNKSDSLRRNVSPQLAQFFRYLFRCIKTDLSENIHYLSSYREPPKPVYGFYPPEDSLNYQGSNFAQILWQYRDKPVYFAHPDLPSPEKKKRYEMPLYDTVEWIMREIVDLKQSVSVNAIADHQQIFEVVVETLGEELKSVTLADVGLGYNQILPVIIQGLLTPPGGLVIFEQPEIHLHPDVQAKLIKFFVGLARADRRVLVETHSSHMIEHLCLEIVRDEANWLVENVQTLFIHAPNANNGPHIEPIEIDPYGTILNWPPHFLPDVAALDEEIIRAGFAKRQKEKESSA